MTFDYPVNIVKKIERKKELKFTKRTYTETFLSSGILRKRFKALIQVINQL